jgi:phenylacetate-CoA ligase
MDRTTPPLDVASATPGIAWPGLPGVAGTSLLGLLFQLDRTQWWPAERIEAAQRRQLAALLDHARAEVPFWRARLPALPPPADATAFEAAWAALPILTRAEIQAADASEAMLADRLPQGHGEYREIFTSGSTGRPIRGVRSQLWELVWSAFTLRDHLWHRRDLAGSLAVIRESAAGKAPYPEGDTQAGWGFSSAAIFATGPLFSLNVTTPPAHQMEWLRRRDPDYLLSHPSILARLALEVGGRPLPRLKQVVAISEALTGPQRATIEAAFRVPVVDVYSTREAGYLALQCPDQAALHVQSEGLRLEVLREDGTPCAPGEVGRVVVTPLHNLAMPLIRYEIGDLAEAGAPCACGRGLPALNRVLGRRQNMLRLAGGGRRWPLLSSGDIERLVAAAPALRQYRIVQTALDALTVMLAVARPVTEAERAAVIAWARGKFGDGFAVTVDTMEELPKSAAGKVEDFVCEVPEAPSAEA